MASLDIYQKINVQVPGQEYPIYIGRNLLYNADLLQHHVHGNQVLIVTNNTIASLYLSQLSQVFLSYQCNVVILKDGEVHKNQENLTKIYDALINHQHHRDTTLIALGGGVIGDITGFAAATYQRGVRFIQFPTTLLAQVDASVGGKTAINHPNAKNMIGSFYQPAAVFIDLNTLITLPEREFYAGFAEIIKYGLLSGGEFLNILIALKSTDLTPKNNQTLADIIATCCKIKANFVQVDEKEQGARALLNLGHTFAHALEAATYYQRWLHGEAVAIGLYCAGLLSFQLGYLSQAELETIDLLLAQANLPRRIPREIDLLDLTNRMFNDKKVKNNRLHLVLIRSLGKCYLDNEIPLANLNKVLIDARI